MRQYRTGAFNILACIVGLTMAETAHAQAPRSKVDMPDNAEIARNTRRRPFVDGRSTHRGFDSGAGPDDRVGADATGDIATKVLGERAAVCGNQVEPRVLLKQQSERGRVLHDLQRIR